MKHYLDAEGGCDGPSETRARPSSSQRAQPSKHRATSPYQVDAGRVVSGYWEPEEPSQLCRGVIAAAGRWRFCVPARYGLNASACGHAVQFPQLLALPRATWTLCARVRSNRHRLWSGGLLQTGDASQGAGVMHTRRRAKTVRYPGGLASSKHPLTLWTARVWRLALMPPRFRALVIFAAFAGLRWGELMALRARDVDLGTGVVHVV